jgi:AP-3 complex subunit beta
VVGSAVMAFEEVCPERTELIHKNYRKLNNLLVDVDEWGQVRIPTLRYSNKKFIERDFCSKVIILNMLLRYARSQLF